MKSIKAFVVGLIWVGLAACGGGGSSSDTSGSTNSTGGTVASSVSLYAPVPSAAVPAVSGDVTADAFGWTNYRRATIGLAPFTRNSLLDKSSAAHSNYLKLNNSYSTEGHNETIGNLGYTGATPGQRIAVVGYADPVTSENMSSTSTLSGRALTDLLVDAPYHRQAQLGAFQDAGAASGPSTDGLTLQYVIDFGGKNTKVGPTARQMVTYPFNGQTGVYVDWMANEVPNPVPDLAGQRVGYPVSIGSPLASSMTVTTFTLSNDKGVNVSTRLITTRTDTNGSLGPYAFVVPLAPLTNGAAYTAHAVGTIDGQPFDLTWAFTTVAASTLSISASTPSLSATVGAQVTVTATGGSGRILGLGVSQGASSSTPLSTSPTFVTITRPTNESVILTRNATACSGTLSNCRVSILATDSVGNTATVIVPIQ